MSVRTGLVLTGGGARGAYQAGALLAITEVAEAAGVSRPFPILTGTSAGAINAMFLASRADAPRQAAVALADLWRSLRAEQVYRTDVLSLGRIGARWLAELSLSGLITHKHANALLDTSPLRRLIEEQSSFGRVAEHVESGALRGAAVTVMDYCCGRSRTFYQGQADPWERFRREGEARTLTANLVMASAAIPILFPPVAEGGHHFGDGSVRNYTPLSPAIKLGAQRLFVIGVRKHGAAPVASREDPPTIARIAGSILSAVLLDAVDLDVERLRRINQTVSVCEAGQTPLSEIPAFVLRPSEDIGTLAAEEVDALPRTLRHLLGGLGSPLEGAELISYLLFEPAFTKRLIDLGYADAKARADEITAFLR